MENAGYVGLSLAPRLSVQADVRRGQAPLRWGATRLHCDEVELELFKSLSAGPGTIGRNDEGQGRRVDRCTQNAYGRGATESNAAKNLVESQHICLPAQVRTMVPRAA